MDRRRSYYLGCSTIIGKTICSFDETRYQYRSELVFNEHPAALSSLPLHTRTRDVSLSLIYLGLSSRCPLLALNSREFVCPVAEYSANTATTRERRMVGVSLTKDTERLSVQRDKGQVQERRPPDDAPDIRLYSRATQTPRGNLLL